MDNRSTLPPPNIGERVRHARIAAGLTQDEVVTRLATVGHSLTKAGLSKYELGKSVPGAAFLLRLGQVLNVPSSYFLRDPEVHISWLAYRKKTRLSQASQDQIRAKALDVVEAYVWLLNRLQIYTDGPSIAHRMPARTLQDAEGAAQWLREKWGLSDMPLESVTQIVEDRGGIIVPASDGEADFDGLSGWVNHALPLAVVNQAVPDDRRRYNLAHELGHLVMDCDGLSVREEEALAHRFAAAFIVPAEVARRELGLRRRQLSIDELGLLKNKYGLSMQAWARRASDLEIIDSGYYRHLCIEFSRRGWRRLEPVVFAGSETPTRLRQLTLRALTEGIVSSSRAEQLCPGCVDRLDTMGGMERMSPRELLRMPYSERARILAVAAADAAYVYGENSELTDFEAMDEADIE